MDAVDRLLVSDIRWGQEKEENNGKESKRRGRKTGEGEGNVKGEAKAKVKRKKQQTIRTLPDSSCSIQAIHYDQCTHETISEFRFRGWKSCPLLPIRKRTNGCEPPSLHFSARTHVDKLGSW